jgi:hypothetical protein
MSSLIHVTAWERVSLGRRVFCAFLRVGVVVITLVVLISLLGPPLAAFLTTRWEARKIPQVWVTPQPLSNYVVSDAPGTRLSYFGYAFEVPWSGDFKTRGGQSGAVEITFDSGQTLLFSVPNNQAGLLSEIVSDPTLHMKNLQSAFRDLRHRSAYDQYAILLNITPASVRAFGTRSEANRDVLLVTIKAIAMPPMLRTGAFSLDYLRV